MLTRVRELHAGELRSLTLRCTRCALLDPATEDGPPPAVPVRLSSIDAGWPEAAEAELGLCGLLATVNDDPVGYLLVSRASALGRRRPRIGTGLAGPGFSSDAAVVIGVYVAPGWRDFGVGKDMVRALAWWSTKHGLRSIEATAARGNFTGKASCAQPPIRWLRAVGFRQVREYPLDTRWRLDLAGTARWRPVLGKAWKLMGGLVWPVPSAEPAHRELTRSDTGN